MPPNPLKNALQNSAVAKFTERVAANIKWITAPAELQREKPTSAAGFSRPVAWLFGREALAALKRLLLFAAYRGRLDQRDWMTAEDCKVEGGVVSAEDGTPELWFDYAADTGDGQMAMYNMAYLWLSDLWTDKAPATGLAVRLAGQQGVDLKLPRGAFLFVGGDTGYYIADHATLKARFQLPFEWAFKELLADRKVRREDRRPLFGIPGNHDYYDQLDGFNRQFRRPSTPEGTPTDKTLNREPLTPQLAIPGFYRVQQASYMAIELPFGWWLWGLDLELKKLDVRQFQYFRRVNGGSIPQKLIVATSHPTTALGTRSKKEDWLAKVFEDLGLNRPFLADKERSPADKERSPAGQDQLPADKERSPAGQDQLPADPERLPAGHVRLDIAGDTHHYARYWGPGGAAARPDAPPAAQNYASVVSGGAGAALHPWQTERKEIEEQVLYPTAAASLADVAGRILNPLEMITGGQVWLFGAVIAVVMYFAAIGPAHTAPLIDQYVLRDRLDISSETVVRFSDHGIDRAQAPLACGVSAEPFFHSFLLWIALIVAGAGIALFNHYYSRHLDRRSHDPNRVVTAGHYWPIWVVNTVLIAGVVLAFARYGGAAFTRVLVDWAFLTIVAGLLLKLTWLGAFAGARGMTAGRKAAFGLLGAWHALLQLCVPLLVMRVGSFWGLCVVAVTAVVFGPAVMWLVRRNKASRWAVLGAWVALGLLLLAVPVLSSRGTATRPEGLLRWVFYAAAAGLGALLICQLFGSYLMVALRFGGHNDEVAGAARSERFKQFVRFRLTPNDLTAFVIAIDDAKVNAAELAPRLVDVFTLKAQA